MRRLQNPELLLAWPVRAEGVGMCVNYEDVDYTTPVCARYGFSTLDDEDEDADVWERGCPECGYNGYMLDMKEFIIPDGFV